MDKTRVQQQQQQQKKELVDVGEEEEENEVANNDPNKSDQFFDLDESQSPIYLDEAEETEWEDLSTPRTTRTPKRKSQG